MAKVTAAVSPLHFTHTHTHAHTHTHIASALSTYFQLTFPSILVLACFFS